MEKEDINNNIMDTDKVKTKKVSKSKKDTKTKKISKDEKVSKVKNDDDFSKVESKKTKKTKKVKEPKKEEDIEDIVDKIEDFEDMDFLSDELFKGIVSYGFKYPSPIQASTIHLINKGCDLMAQAHSGTGKTGAFSIGSLSRIEKNKKHPQVIVVANTKILASQIKLVMQNIAKYMNLKFCLCVGGIVKSEDNLKEALSSHVLIGTPGRLGDVLYRGVLSKKIDKDAIKTLIMDETDVLLQDEFVEQVKKIIGNVGKKTQICIFSATFTSDTFRYAEDFLNNPFKITIKKEELSLDKVKQFEVNVGRNNGKMPTLIDLLSKIKIQQMIVFVNSKYIAESIRDRLFEEGHEAGLVVGKMNNEDREKVLTAFRLQQYRILISTDIASRGFDVDDLRCVINYDFPKDADTYLHRVGRSGRYGSQGIALNFTTHDDFIRVNELKSRYKVSMPHMPNPDEINNFLDGIELPSNKVLGSKLYMED